MTTSQPWWLTNQYLGQYPIPAEFGELAGSNGMALVQTWANGKTQPGWGYNPPPGSNEGFMPRYLRGEFQHKKALFQYNRVQQPFAFVMRSVRMVCIDIDGKNGGFDHVKKLGLLTPTLAETSKSGNGYHLFYRTDEEWDTDKGYAQVQDHIGIVQGVDIRGTGCVYHYPTQRWNDHSIARLPAFMAEMLEARRSRSGQQAARVATALASGDPLEIAMMHDDLLDQLKKPIDPGKRNNTLFAIGSQMMNAGTPKWDELVAERANQVGLDNDEIDKLIGNISRYAPVQP